MSREAAIAAAKRAMMVQSRSDSALSQQAMEAAIETGTKALGGTEFARRVAEYLIRAVLPHLAPALKAEALREAADRPLRDHTVLGAGWRIYLHEEADRIERGEL